MARIRSRTFRPVPLAARTDPAPGPLTLRMRQLLAAIPEDPQPPDPAPGPLTLRMRQLLAAIPEDPQPPDPAPGSLTLRLRQLLLDRS
jgi:hypothetical protein